jgi:hypothetical protein
LSRAFTDGCVKLTLLKVTPPFHGDLATIELAFIFNASLLDFFTTRLAGITPTKIIKLPVCVCWQDKVPDGERDEVDQHPCHV